MKGRKVDSAVFKNSEQVERMFEIYWMKVRRWRVISDKKRYCRWS